MTSAERIAREAALEAAEKLVAVLRDELAADDIGTPDVSAALRIKDVCADYGVSDKTARRWAKSRGFRRGGVLFIRRDAIESARS